MISKHLSYLALADLFEWRNIIDESLSSFPDKLDKNCDWDDQSDTNRLRVALHSVSLETRIHEEGRGFKYLLRL